MVFLSKSRQPKSWRPQNRRAPKGWRKNRLQETSVRRHERDFAFQREQAASAKEERKPSSHRRNIILAVFAVVLLAIAGGLMIFHPAFGIQVITVQGLNRTSYAEVQKTAEQLMASPRFGFLPRRNYFLVNSEELNQVIKDRFSLEKVEIQQIFPHALIITVKEREPILVVAEHNQVSVVDQNGEIVEKIGRLPGSDRVETEASSTVSIILTSDLNSVRAIVNAGRPDIKKLPILMLNTNTVISTSTPEAKAELLSGVLAWNLFLRDQKMPVSGYVLENGGSGEVTLIDRPKLLVNFVHDRDKQFLGLITFLKEKKSIFETTTSEYLDLRYPGKVFWK